jgi:hypothetical protein
MRPSVLSAAFALAFAIPSLAAPDAKKPAPTDDSAKIAEKLLDRIDQERIDKTPLRDVLDFLQQRTDLTILLDSKALVQEGVAESPEMLEAMSVVLPAMKKVRIETVLKLVADQIGADFYIAPDHVKITSPTVKDLVTGRARPLPDLYGGEATEEQVDRKEVIRTAPFVTATFKDTPVGEALRDVAARAGRNVVLSAAAADAAETKVTVALSNVAFETAAASLAEAAGLRAFRTGNVVVLVTPERAKQLESPPDGGPRVTLGGLGGAGSLMTLGELESIARLFANKPVETEARRKELEEKVRKLTEELQKLKK